MRMASLKQSAVLFLFLVHICVAIGGPYYGSSSSPISSDEYEMTQIISRSAVEVYNKKGESNLTFIEFVRGTRYYYYFPNTNPRWTRPIWTLDLNAKNCSEPGNPTALYFTVLEQNGGYGVQFQSYGLNFTFFHLGKY